MPTLFLISVCIVLSFLFSGMEAGVFALNRLRIRRQMRAGVRPAELLHECLRDPEDFLWTILIGNTLATFAACGILVAQMHEVLVDRPIWFAVAFLGVALLFYTFCDLLPKMLFRQFPTRLCLAMARPFRVIHFVLSPAVGLLRWFSDRILGMSGRSSFKGHLFGDRSELRFVMQDTGQSLTTEERVMINRVLDLQNVQVRSIAVPLGKVLGVSPGTSTGELLELCKQQRLSRVPVWSDEGEARKVLGVVSLRSLVYSAELDLAQPVKSWMTPALYLREDLRLEEALARMQRSGQRLAVVLALDQRELGIVSLQDILRNMFGEVNL